MVPLFVDVEVRDRCVMTIEVGQVLESVRLPENDVSLFSATCDESVLCGVHKTVDSFLMEIEGLSAVLELVQIVHVDESIQR